MLKTAGTILGSIAGLFSIGLWIVLNFFNPYSSASIDRAR